MTTAHPIHLDIVCPECGFDGPAPLSLGDGPRVVTCPECHEEWKMPPPISGASGLVAWTPLARTMLCLNCQATFALAPTTLGGTKPCPRCGSDKFIPIARWLDREQEGGQ